MVIPSARDFLKFFKFSSSSNILTITISPAIPFLNIGKSCRKTQLVYTTESHEMPSHPCLQLSPLFAGLYVKTYPGTTSRCMRHHLGSGSTINGANWEDPDANEENPQGPSRQDLRHALCIRLEVSLVFILLFSILFGFLTPPKYDSVTLTVRAHFRELTPCPSLIWSKRSLT